VAAAGAAVAAVAVPVAAGAAERVRVGVGWDFLKPPPTRPPLRLLPDASASMGTAIRRKKMVIIETNTLPALLCVCISGEYLHVPRKYASTKK